MMTTTTTTMTMIVTVWKPQVIQAMTPMMVTTTMMIPDLDPVRDQVTVTVAMIVIHPTVEMDLHRIQTPTPTLIPTQIPMRIPMTLQPLHLQSKPLWIRALC